MLSWTKKITFLFLLLFSPFSVTAQVEEWMPDATLRQAVLTKLDLPAGAPLTKDKMLSLESLDSVNHLDTNASIVDITGLEYAKNLRYPKSRWKQQPYPRLASVIKLDTPHRFTYLAYNLERTCHGSGSPSTYEFGAIRGSFS